ncbi:MAG: hypothetical protein IKX32_02040, partial [Bacteroidales bacterium]|nr:hypothetical protein [Bacteroidales bacterium]
MKKKMLLCIAIVLPLCFASCNKNNESTQNENANPLIGTWCLNISDYHFTLNDGTINMKGRLKSTLKIIDDERGYIETLHHWYTENPIVIDTAMLECEDRYEFVYEKKGESCINIIWTSGESCDHGLSFNGLSCLSQSNNSIIANCVIH